MKDPREFYWKLRQDRVQAAKTVLDKEGVSYTTKDQGHGVEEIRLSDYDVIGLPTIGGLNITWFINKEPRNLTTRQMLKEINYAK